MNIPSNQTILFLHIPKSAGTTMSSCLTEYYYNKNFTKTKISQNTEIQQFYEGDIFYYPIGFYKDPENWFPKYTIPFLKMPGLRMVSGHFSYGIHKYIPSETKYITILRNPVNRIISLYYHLLSTNIICEKISLQQFLEGIPDNGWLVNLKEWHPIDSGFEEQEIRNYSKCIIDNDQTRRISGIEPPFGQCNEAMFNIACQNIKKRFAFVGITEKFDETILLLCNKLKWSNESHYFPKLVNRKKSRLTEYSDQLISKIEQLNYWDIKLYKYAKQIFYDIMKDQDSNFIDQLIRFKKSNMEFINHNNCASQWDIGIT